MNSGNVDEVLSRILELFGDARVFLAMEVLEKIENYLKTEPNHPVLEKLDSLSIRDILRSLRDKNDRLRKTLQDTETVKFSGSPFGEIKSSLLFYDL